MYAPCLNTVSLYETIVQTSAKSNKKLYIPKQQNYLPVQLSLAFIRWYGRTISRDEGPS